MLRRLWTTRRYETIAPSAKPSADWFQALSLYDLAESLLGLCDIPPHQKRLEAFCADTVCVDARTLFAANRSPSVDRDLRSAEDGAVLEAVKAMIKAALSRLCNIVVSTPYASREQHVRFFTRTAHLHVVDEACNMTVSAAMQAIGPEISRDGGVMEDSYARNLPRQRGQRWIIVGDFNQLNPVVKSRYAKKPLGDKLLPVSCYSRVRESSLGHHVLAAHFLFLYLDTLYRFVPGFAQPMIDLFQHTAACKTAQ